MQTAILAIGLVLVIEGLAYALAALRNPHKPVPWRRGRP